jgi:hypothetical protein
MEPEFNKKFSLEDKAKFMAIFSVENMAAGAEESDRWHKQLLAEAEANPEPKPRAEDDSEHSEHDSDDSARTIQHEYCPDAELYNNSDDSARTHVQPYVPDAEQPACVPVPVQGGPLLVPVQRGPLLSDQAMKESCSRFLQEIRAMRKPCIGKTQIAKRKRE